MLYSPYSRPVPPSSAGYDSPEQLEVHYDSSGMPSMDALAQHADNVCTRGFVTDLHFNSMQNKDELVRLRRRYRRSNAPLSDLRGYCSFGSVLSKSTHDATTGTQLIDRNKLFSHPRCSSITTCIRFLFRRTQDASSSSRIIFAKSCKDVRRESIQGLQPASAFQRKCKATIHWFLWSWRFLKENALVPGHLWFIRRSKLRMDEPTCYEELKVRICQ